MGFFDADSHVDETLATWDYLTADERKFLPQLLDPPGGHGFLIGDTRPHQIWLIAGTTRLKRWRDDELTGTTVETRELIDVPARLAHMDKLGCDVQVIYPTMFIHTVATRPDVEAAIHGSYNRWLADRTAASNGRLRWAYLPPILSMDWAVRDMRWAKEHGACAVMKKGIEYGMAASDPYFFPLYAEAERLDIPICFHAGDGNAVSNTAPDASMQHFNVLHAFRTLAEDMTPERFPRLRFGFIETGASWIPYQMKQIGMRGRYQKYHCDFRREFLSHYRFFVTCDTEDDLAMIVDRSGAADSLVIGTDYSHSDLSGELGAHQLVADMGASGELDRAVAQKIVESNARRLYGL